MQSTRLTGKVGLITGGAAGIGAASAKLFLEQGALGVVLVDQNREALAHTIELLAKTHGRERVSGLALDTAVPQIANQAVLHAINTHGKLDVLVNNAAMRNYLSIDDANPDTWMSLLQVNLIGSAQFCTAAMPYFRKQNKGAIINVSSCYALTGRKGMTMYDASKAALLALTRSVAHEGAADGIRCNAICPGSTLTDFHINRAKAAGKSIDALATERDTNSLIGRWARPEEIAWPIVWLASDEASFITGAVLPVDGGLTAM